MKIRELFVADVTRHIPPVVYFHEQSREKLAEEVSEYIITGGYLEGDPRALRVQSGIHEQFVHLLRSIGRELAKVGGPELPASWISGFYGSGKSSFAKLLGLSLDGVVLPNGTLLGAALLERDGSPRRQDLVDAWNGLTQCVDPIAVVFDIGGVARDDEPLHAAALRLVQARLGYCSKSDLVAEFELRLERDGEWDAFVEVAKKTLKKAWSLAKEEEQAEDHFSHVLHVMKPERYPGPTSWIDSAGSRAGSGKSVREVVERLEFMLERRAPGKTLFIVVDEVSQYVRKDEGRMLKLQAFVSELGQRLKGRVWLFATGQQKLEDAEVDDLGKLKDRFPPELRVHLGTTNIRDVVHERLLKKSAKGTKALRKLFNEGSNRANLKLYAYGCQDLGEEDFIDVYPMLPGHIDLLMQITSSLRARSPRVQGEGHAIRGVLQLLGELFRERKLADGELGELVSLDAIFEVLRSALDSDIQATLSRIFSDPRVCDDAWAVRAAKAVALLELIQEHTPTTPELIASCLYARLGEGNRIPAVSEALERLRASGLLSYSEKQGFKLQSSAGEEWQRERDDLGVTQEQLGKSVQEALKNLVGSTQERPRWKNRTFPWTLWFSDGRLAQDVKLQDAREDSTVAVDFRFIAEQAERTPASWVPRSDQEPLRNRLLWVVGELGEIEHTARQLVRSEHLLTRYQPRRETLPHAKQRLLIEEEARREELERRLRVGLAEAFFEGTAYFRGQQIRPREVGSNFASALAALAARVLPELYPHFSEIVISPKELEQLLEKDLTGPSTKFMEGNLGILALDSGKYVAACTGLYPERVAREIQRNSGLSGQALIATFSSPPYGYAPDLVKACCAGLLRAKKLRIRPEQGTEIKSPQDPGVRDLFSRDRDFRRAEFFPGSEGEVSQRDRIAIRKLFEKYLELDIEPEDEPIADAIEQQFPACRERLRDLERRFAALPCRSELPAALQKLGRALEDGIRSRFVVQRVSEVKRNLSVLRAGFEELGLLSSELTPEAVEILSAAARVRDQELSQLLQIEKLGDLGEAAERVPAQLTREHPWRGARELVPILEQLRDRYREVRKALLNQQNLEAEAARARIKARPSFAALDADEAHRALRPIAEALVDTTPEAISPTLVELRDRFRSSIQLAEDAANDRLDEALAKRDEKPVLKLDPELRGREIRSAAELEAALRELEDRIAALLSQGARVRLT